MENMTYKTKRRIGAVLAALTVTAGMSAVAFAGEPAQNDTDGKKDGAEMAGNAMKAVECTEAIKAEIKVDPETGETLYSIDNGSMWLKLEPTVKYDADGVKAENKIEWKDVISEGDMESEGEEAAESATLMATLLLTKTDEETGKVYVSDDNGETWEEVDDADMIPYTDIIDGQKEGAEPMKAMELVPSQPAEAK